MKKILIAIAAIGLFSTVYADQKDSYEKSTDSKKIGWMQKGMDATKSKLKDPESAKFRGVYFNRGADSVPMTCGEVNSKNSLGGYSGYQKFVSACSPDLTFLEEQVTDFTTVWGKFCL